MSWLKASTAPEGLWAPWKTWSLVVEKVRLRGPVWEHDWGRGMEEVGGA